MKVFFTKVETMEMDGLTASDIVVMKKAGWTVEEIDGEIPIGFCEICERPIFENDEYGFDEDGIYWHSECDR